ncbi:MAG: T9SS type A sorting domain-containing protein, partial [Bacteroidales bacterium]|nr:T9SS type A sorting domain-containing protein [Bacteroidales bacterium]
VTQQLSQPFVVPFATKENPTFSFRLEALLPCDAATGDNSISLTGKVNVPDTTGTDTNNVDTIGIRIAKRVDWQLGQNIPNPASDITVIPFMLPQGGEVTISVLSANGQLINRRRIQAQAGENTVSISTEGWADGLYYYRMEYNGRQQVRKMNIVR